MQTILGETDKKGTQLTYQILCQSNPNLMIILSFGSGANVECGIISMREWMICVYVRVFIKLNITAQSGFFPAGYSMLLASLQWGTCPYCHENLK